MKNIPLNVLDAYAKRLTPTLVSKLYEAKTHKQYVSKLYENSKPLTMYVDTYNIANDTQMTKSEFALWLNENRADLMNNISYKIEDDAITFKTNSSTQYSKLIESLMAAGISGSTIERIKDTKF